MRVQRFNEAAAVGSGVSPTMAQIAQQAGVSVEEVIEAREAYQALYADSLDQPRRSSDTDERSVSLLETMGTRDTGFENAFDRVLLDSLLETLEEQDRTIVRLYHLEGLTQAEIGDRLGYSQMHISRLLRRATAELAEVAARQSDLTARSAA